MFLRPIWSNTINHVDIRADVYLNHYFIPLYYLSLYHTSLVDLLFAYHNVYSTLFLGLLTLFTNKECKLSILP